MNEGNEQRKDLYFIKHEIVDMTRQYNDLFAKMIEHHSIIEQQHDIIMNISIDQRAIRAHLIEQ